MSDAFLLEISEKLLRENKKLKGTLAAKYRQGYKAGGLKEIERIIGLAKNRICFDHKNGCDHASCYALCDLIELIQKEENE